MFLFSPEGQMGRIIKRGIGSPFHSSLQWDGGRVGTAMADEWCSQHTQGARQVPGVGWGRQGCASVDFTAPQNLLSACFQLLSTILLHNLECLLLVFWMRDLATEKGAKERQNLCG